MLTDHGLCTSLQRDLKIEKNRSSGVRQKVQSSRFLEKLLGADKARAALDFGAKRAGAGRSPEAAACLKAASLCGTHGVESGPAARGWGPAAVGHANRLQGESLGILLPREQELWPLPGRGQLRTPGGHLTVPLQSSRDSAAPRNSDTAKEDARIGSERSCSEHLLC